MLNDVIDGQSLINPLNIQSRCLVVQFAMVTSDEFRGRARSGELDGGGYGNKSLGFDQRKKVDISRQFIDQDFNDFSHFSRFGLKPTTKGILATGFLDQGASNKDFVASLDGEWRIGHHDFDTI